MQQQRRSVRFVDLAFIGLLFAWIIPVWLENVTNQPTPEMKPVLAKVVEAAGRCRRRYAWAEVEYKFTGPDGRVYRKTMTSFPVIIPYSKALSDLQSRNDLMVYYSPSNPNESTSPEVAKIFADTVAWNYAVTTFIFGFIKTCLNGMSVMSGER